MAYEVIPENGETVQGSVRLNVSKKVQPFCFVVSDRAIYIPRIKLIAKTDPYYLQRVRLEQVQHVTIKRLPPFALWLLAGLMILIGLLSTIFMMEPVFQNEPGEHRISGWPIAVFVCGFIVPFVARGRFGLDISLSDGRYRWKPPLVVDRASKQKVAEVLQIVAEACEKVGIRVSDERGK